MIPTLNNHTMNITVTYSNLIPGLNQRITSTQLALLTGQPQLPPLQYISSPIPTYLSLLRITEPLRTTEAVRRVSLMWMLPLTDRRQLPLRWTVLSQLIPTRFNPPLVMMGRFPHSNAVHTNGSTRTPTNVISLNQVNIILF